MLYFLLRHLLLGHAGTINSLMSANDRPLTDYLHLITGACSYGVPEAALQDAVDSVSSMQVWSETSFNTDQPVADALVHEVFNNVIFSLVRRYGEKPK